MPLTTMQKLMRHSSPNLTANAYTAVAMKPLAAAVEKLPPPVRPKPASAGPVAARRAPRRRSWFAARFAAAPAPWGTLGNLPDPEEGFLPAGGERNSACQKGWFVASCKKRLG